VSNALVPNSNMKLVDNLPLLTLVPAAVVGWLLGRFLGSGFVALLFFALIAAIIRYAILKIRNRKLQRQAQYISQVHENAQALAAKITEAVSELEQANQDLGFAEATFGTPLMASHRTAINEAYLQVNEAWKLQEALSAFDGTQQLNESSDAARVLELCEAISTKTANQAGVINSYQGALDDAPKTLTNLRKQIADCEIKLSQAKLKIAKLELPDANTLLNLAEEKLAEAQAELSKAENANALNDRPNYLASYSKVKLCIGELMGKLRTVNAYADKVSAEREQIRQAEARAAAEKAEQARRIAAQRKLDADTVAALESVSGLGPKRRDAILEHFGSWAAVRKASPQELTRVNSIGPSLAQAIWAAMSRLR